MIFHQNTVKLNIPTIIFSAFFTINDAEIISIIEKKSIDLKQISSQKIKAQVAFDKIDTQYNPYINFDLSREVDNTSTLTNSNKQNLKKIKFLTSIGKNFDTGTQLNFEAQYNKFSSESNLNNPAVDFDLDLISINLQQKLYPDFLGFKERELFISSQKNLNKEHFQNELDLIESVKAALTVYWKTRVLKTQVELNQILIEKYNRLLNQLARKRNNSMTAPGEFEQTTAEILTKKQNLNDDKIQLENSILKLKNLLLIPAETDLKFSTSAYKANLSDLLNKKIDPQNNLKYLLQKVKAESAKNLLNATEQGNSPELSIYSKYVIQGLDAEAQTAFNQLNEAQYNKYTIGLKLNYSFGGDQNKNVYLLQKINSEIEIERFTNTTENLNAYFSTMKNQITFLEAAVKNNEEIYKLRQIISKKFEANYSQGRTDLSQLIETYNREFAAKANLINSNGQLQILSYEFDKLTSPQL